METRVVIIGTGFAGLGMAIRLKQEGIHDLVLLEKESEIGGVWRDNHYPGAACDVPSHLYSFSFERDFDWSRSFGPRDDILRYLRHCADKYGLRPHIRTGQEVREARYDAGAARWEVECSDGTTYRCAVLITGTGQLGRPSIPRFEGMERFAGESFHSARWDHDCPLEGKRVAVIGTGASAIQFVPPVAAQAAELTVFQRSAPYVVEKNDAVYGRFRRWLYRTFPILVTLHRGWIYASAEKYFPAFRRSRLLAAYARWTFRWHLRRQVPDPALRAKLMPDHEFGCKRVLFSNDWYPALGRENVHVETAPISRVEADAIVTKDGRRHPADCIIFGTGFDASHFLAPIEVKGLLGQSIHEAWKDGAHAYLGITVRGFPNLFMLYGPNTNLGHNSIVYMLESQFRYVLSALEAIEARGGALHVRAEAEAAFRAELRELLAGTVWQSGCQSWYLDAHGRNTNNWPDFTFRYRERTRAVDLADYEVIAPAAVEATTPAALDRAAAF